MIDRSLCSQKLLNKMNEKHISTGELAQELNITEKTMINKMRNPAVLFSCDQIIATYEILGLTQREAIEIFFPRVFEKKLMTI